MRERVSEMLPRQKKSYCRRRRKKKGREERVRCQLDGFEGLQKKKNIKKNVGIYIFRWWWMY
jgi:hypothetical protein